MIKPSYLFFTTLSLLAVTVHGQEAKEKITYMDHVLPVLENACLNCHNPDEAKGGLDLSSYGATMTGGSGGSVVDPGNADGSRLFTLMAHTEEPHMPPEKPVSPKDQLDVIKKWIDGGLLQTKDSTAKKSDKPKFDAVVQVGDGKPENPAMPEHVVIETEVVTPRANAITAIATSPWAPLVAIGGQKQVLLYNSNNFELLGILPFPEGFPESLAFSRNGSLIIAGGGRGGKIGMAVAWDVTNGERVIEVGREFDTALAVAISPTHKLVSLGGPGRNIKVFDTTSGEQLHSLKKHPDWLLELEYSPDGVLMASGGRNGGLYVWEAASGIEFYELKEHQRAITGMSWRADSNMLAACSEDGQVSVWEMRSGKQVKKWNAHSGGALGIHFSPDGSKVATCGRDQRVKIWDLDGKMLREIKDFPDLVTSVAFTHDGKRVISGDWTGAVKVWDAENGNLVGQMVTNPPKIADRITSSKNRVAELNKAIPGYEATLKKASDTVSGNKALQDAKNQLAAAQKEKATLEGQIKAEEQKLAGATEEVNKAKASVEAKKKALADSQAAVKKLTDGQAAAKKELDKWEAEFKKQNESWLKAKQEVESLKGQVAQLPDNADLKTKLAAAEKRAADGEGLVKQADQKRKEAGNAIKGADPKIAEAKKNQPMLETELKAAELVLTQRNKTYADLKKPIDEKKGKLAAVNKSIETHTNTVKSEEEKMKGLLAEQNKAKGQLDQAKFDLKFLQYELAKLEAAAVNVVLRDEQDSLQNSRERLIDLEGTTKSAENELEKAVAAVVEAEKTLASAKKTILDGNKELESALDRVLKARLNLITIRALEDKAKSDEAPAAKPEEEAAKAEAAEVAKADAAPAPEEKKDPAVELASLEPFVSQVSEMKKAIEETYKLAASTEQKVQKATEVAKKTPALIAERKKEQEARKSELQKTLESKKRQESTLEEQEKRVDQLEKKYFELYRKAEESGPDTVASK